MASVAKKTLISSQAAGAITGDAVTLELKMVDLVAVLTATAYTTGTIGGSIEHSADGSNWIEIAAFSTGLTATGAEELTISAPVLTYIRAKMTGGVGTAQIDLFYDKN